MPKVVRLLNNSVPLMAKRVDSQTRYGNPFIIGVDGTRDMVCDLFREYAKWRLTIQPEWLKLLRGFDLACHCTPLSCHAEILIELANADSGEVK